MHADVFISHSTADKDIAERVCRILEARGLVCWIASRDVPLGASWPAAIGRAIEEAKTFVVVLSPASNASQHVVTEVTLAFAQRKTLFVFRTHDILPTEDLQYFLACPQWADGFPPPLEDRVAGMASALRLLLAKDRLKPAPEDLRRPETGHAPVERRSGDLHAESVRRAGHPRVPARALGQSSVPGRGADSLPATERPARGRGVFDSRGRVQSDAFAFAIDGVLLRAARRRNEQGRSKATVADLIAGLLRTGGLTRLIVKRTGRDPDALYAQLLVVPERHPTGPGSVPPDLAALNDGTVPDASRLQAMLARWLLRNADDFAADLIALFDRASARAEGPITERALLEEVVETPTWASAGVDLPAVSETRAVLAECTRTQTVDANGAVPMACLSSAARRIVLRAHLLSQQCRAAAITHRLFLAALVEEETGFAARVCRCAGVDTGLLQRLLVTISAASDQDVGSGSSNVILSADVCARVVTPVLAEARRSARDREHITEQELFRAFCRAAAPGFGAFLKARSTAPELEPIEADLLELASLDPDHPDRLAQLTLRAREVVRWAHGAAQALGVRTIPNRLMLAAFLAREDAHARGLLDAHHVPAQKARDLMMASVGAGTAASFDLDDEAAARIITPLVEWARHLAGDGELVTEALLFRAFCDVADADFKAALSQVGIDLDPFATGSGMSPGKERRVTH